MITKIVIENLFIFLLAPLFFMQAHASDLETDFKFHASYSSNLQEGVGLKIPRHLLEEIILRNKFLITNSHDKKHSQDKIMIRNQTRAKHFTDKIDPGLLVKNMEPKINHATLMKVSY